jgi:hypothetical protein
MGFSAAGFEIIFWGLIWLREFALKYLRNISYFIRPHDTEIWIQVDWKLQRRHFYDGRQGARFWKWRHCRRSHNLSFRRRTFFNWAPRHEVVLGEWRYSSTYSLTSALDGGGWSASHPDRFIPRERAPGTHWTGGWVGPRAVLDAVAKRKIPSSRRESNRPARSPALYRLSYRGSLEELNT